MLMRRVRIRRPMKRPAREREATKGVAPAHRDEAEVSTVHPRAPASDDERAPRRRARAISCPRHRRPLGSRPRSLCIRLPCPPEGSHAGRRRSEPSRWCLFGRSLRLRRGPHTPSAHARAGRGRGALRARIATARASSRAPARISRRALAATHGSTAPDASPMSSAISWASESIKRIRVYCSRVTSAELAVITRATSAS